MFLLGVLIDSLRHVRVCCDWPGVLVVLRHAVIARSEVQMETGDEFLNFNIIKNWSPSQERSH